jgi:hypothetical protein
LGDHGGRYCAGVVGMSALVCERWEDAVFGELKHMQDASNGQGSDKIFEIRLACSTCPTLGPRSSRGE